MSDAEDPGDYSAEINAYGFILVWLVAEHCRNQRSPAAALRRFKEHLARHPANAPEAAGGYGIKDPEAAARVAQEATDVGHQLAFLLSEVERLLASGSPR